jgi:hypothetical protein
MSLLIPKSFSTKTGSVQLSDLDTNFTYLTSTVNTALDITGTAVTGYGNTTVYGTLGASGAVTLANNLTVGGTIGASGAVTLASTLDVTGAATLRSASSTIPTGGRLSGTDVGSIKAPGLTIQTVYLRFDTKTSYAFPAYAAGTTPNGVFITDLSTTITPKFSDSKILIHFCPSFEVDQDTVWLLYRNVAGVDTLIARNNTADNRWSGWVFNQYDQNNSSTPQTENFMFYDTPGTAAAITYKFYIQSSGVGASSLYLNRTFGSTGQSSYENAISQVFLQEIAQ